MEAGRDRLTWPREAAAYCRWLTAALNDGHVYHLPTEAEWERAARGPTSSPSPHPLAGGEDGGGGRYPWGDDWADDHCNSEESNLGRTTPVGCFPTGASAEPERIHDLAGNAWEWCSDRYDEKAYAGRADRVTRNPTGAERDDYRVLRGGSWYYNRTYVRCAIRFRNDPDDRNGNAGFRVARGSP